MSQQLVAAGVEQPKKRPSTRPYAEYRGCDPEGNWFDISQHGFETVETDAERAKKKELAGAKKRRETTAPVAADLLGVAAGRANRLVGRILRQDTGQVRAVDAAQLP